MKIKNLRKNIRETSRNYKNGTCIYSWGRVQWIIKKVKKGKHFLKTFQQQKLSILLFYISIPSACRKVESPNIFCYEVKVYNFWFNPFHVMCHTSKLVIDAKYILNIVRVKWWWIIINTVFKSKGLCNKVFVVFSHAGDNEDKERCCWLSRKFCWHNSFVLKKSLQRHSVNYLTIY